MNTEALNKVLDSVQYGGKSPSRELIQKYRIPLLEGLGNKKLTDEAIHYIIAGIQLESIDVFLKWNNNQDDDTKLYNYQRILETKELMNLKDDLKLKIFFQILANLFHEDQECIEIERVILSNLPGLSKIKSGKIRKNINNVFDNYFLLYLVEPYKFPQLEKMDLTYDQSVEILELFETIVIGSKKIKYNNNDQMKRSRQYAFNIWVRDIKKKIEAFNENDTVNVESNNENDINENTQKEVSGEMTIDQKSIKSDNIEAEKKVYIPQSLVARGLSKAIEKYVIKFDKLEDKLENEKKKNIVLIHKINSVENNLVKLETKYRSLVERERELNITIKEYEDNIRDLKKHQKELSDKIVRQGDVINVYDEDKQKQKGELVNQIASSLKTIYQDFQSAKDMEMDIDLGENMRDSVDDIFRKLKKFGVDIEGR